MHEHQCNVKDSGNSQASGSIGRRELLMGAAAVVASGSVKSMSAEAKDSGPYKVKHGRIHQSVCQWCFDPMPVETLAKHAEAFGMESVELSDPKDWPILKKHGLVCAITMSHGFTDGMNRKENHEMCLEQLRTAIDATSAAGFPNVITFSGMRKGMPDDVGLENAVIGLKKIIGHAEKKKVNICLEMLNSRVDSHPMKGHPDYMCDNLEWAIELCDRISSERMKLLFDIYHVQVMQGDVITRIKACQKYTAHYHTAGVPGRCEINDDQELNYPPIMKAILDTGYTGYIGQEFIPMRKDMAYSLNESVRICDV
jgi:hydroxypyruvate isomerase